MELLCYKTLKSLSYPGYLLENAPVRVLQFGEGNFLRAFVDYFIDIMNEKTGFHGKVLLVQPIPQGRSAEINAQEGLYTLYLRGSKQGQRVDEHRIISSIAGCINPYQEYDAFLACAKNPDLRFLVSNTTEAGIAFDESCRLEDRPAASFPGKLTQFLYERWRNGGRGFWILSCELIDRNGQELKACVQRYIELWHLEPAFADWVEQDNHFCSTLVDRIVTGYPEQDAVQMNRENGYLDRNLVTAECFGLWVIEAPDVLYREFPVREAQLPILVVPDQTPYKQRKVRILNGAHTGMVLGAYLTGQNIVRDCMHDPVIRKFMEQLIFDEIIPSIKTLPQEELRQFAKAVLDRFENPYIDHKLLDIALNSVSKWRARILPSLLSYLHEKKTLPVCLTFSFAALLEFYSRGTLQNGVFRAVRGKDLYEIRDEYAVLAFFAALDAQNIQALTDAACRRKDFWGMDLTEIPGFAEAVATYLANIRENGAFDAMKAVICTEVSQ